MKTGEKTVIEKLRLDIQSYCGDQIFKDIYQDLFDKYLQEEIEQIKDVYNLKENINGEKIKILLGSRSIKEGVSLKAVKQVHILEPYWNKSRLEQVIRRASRFCSHKDLPIEKRTVKVYIYVSVSKGLKINTIDQRIELLSHKKDKIIRIFEKYIKESAIDCELNKNANVYDNEEDIKCDK
jgi:hypothetical protein